MDRKNEKHLNTILNQAVFLIDRKYRAGAEEHFDTYLEDLSSEKLLDEAINEAIDQIVYLLTLKDTLKKR